MIFMYGVFGFIDVLKKYMQDERIAKHIDKGAFSGGNTESLENILLKPILKVSKRYSIPILYINPENYSSPWSLKIRESGAILFQFWDRPVRCMSKICDYIDYKQINEINN